MTRKGLYKKQRARRQHALVRNVQRQNDAHDRWYVLAFMRESIKILAPKSISVDHKVFAVARIARRLAPAIMKRRECYEGIVEMTPRPSCLACAIEAHMATTVEKPHPVPASFHSCELGGEYVYG